MRILVKVALTVFTITTLSFAGGLEIIGMDRQNGIMFKGASQSNYYTLEFASSTQGPWTNWGAVSQMPITGEVMSTSIPMLFRIRQVADNEFPVYATGTPVYVESDPVWTDEKDDFYPKVEANELFATGTPLYVFNETDPIYQAEKSLYATGFPVYIETDPSWTADKINYYPKTEADELFATGTPLYVLSEHDPFFESQKTNYAKEVTTIALTARIAALEKHFTPALSISATSAVFSSNGATSTISVITHDKWWRYNSTSQWIQVISHSFDYAIPRTEELTYCYGNGYGYGCGYGYLFFGSGSVDMKIFKNYSTTARNGTVTFADQTFTVQQQ